MSKKVDGKNRKRFSPQKSGGLILFVMMLLAITFLLYYNSVTGDSKVINYSEFMRAAVSGQIKRVTVQNWDAVGELTNGIRFRAHIVPDSHVWRVLYENGANVDVVPPDSGTWFAYFFFALIALLVSGLIFYIFNRGPQAGGGPAGKIFSIGKSKAKFFSPNTVNVTFNDVAGVEEAKADLKDIIEFLKSPKKFERLGARVPRGILLSGAPGTGKTLLAKAVAGESGCNFLSISGSDFVEVFVGVGASRVRDMFAQARKHSPCIVFIDEIDAVGRQRGIGLGGGNDEREQTLNQLLAEMDGFSTEHGAVIVLAATNRPDVLDKALLRPGRFDRVIEVPYPDLRSREKILRVHAKGVKIDPAVDLHKIARGTPGFSGADLANLINEAALIASKKNQDSVKIDDFEKARDKLILGAENKSLMLSEKEKKRTAYHEGGHTLLNVLLPNTDPLHKVTIVPRGRTLGASWSFPLGDKVSRTKSEMLDSVVVAFGGHAAEKIVFNEISSGAANDIEYATKIARLMVARYGMSDELGPIMYDETKDHPYLGRDIQRLRTFSDATVARVDVETEKIVKRCYEKAKKILSENRGMLDKLAGVLLERESLDAKEVYELLGLPEREYAKLS